MEISPMNCLKLLLALTLLAAGACQSPNSEHPTEASDKQSTGRPYDFVQELTNEFTKFYRELYPTLVMFYTPWCTYSQELLPHLAQLATIFSGSIKIAKLDISTYPDQARFFQVKHTPTIAYVSMGKTLVCEQELTFEGLLRFATAAAGPALFEVNTTQLLDQWMGNYSAVFLLAHSEEISESWHNVYRSVAEQKRTSLRFLYTTQNEMIQERFGVKQFPALMVLKDGHAFMYDDPVVYHSISLWVEKERLPTLIHLNLTTVQRYSNLPSGKKMVLLLANPTAHKKAHDIIKRVAEGRRFHSGYQFALTEDADLFTAITGSSPVVTRPHLLAWDTDQKTFYLPSIAEGGEGEGELSAKVVTAFLLDVSKGKVKPQVISRSYYTILEEMLVTLYGISWTMYTHRPILSLISVTMPIVGVYLLFFGPRNRGQRIQRPLRRRPRNQRQPRESSDLEPITAGDNDSSGSAADRTEPRKRVVNNTSNHDD